MNRADVLEIATRLAQEREDAEPVVTTIRNTIKDVWDQPMPDAWRTVGVVTELIRAADDLLEQDPPLSRELAQFALAISTAIDPAAYPGAIVARAEGQAFRALGVAHRYLSDFTSALRAFDAAARIFEEYPALEHDAATILLARAITLSAMQHPEEALAMIDQAADALAAFDDQSRLIQCELVRAMTHHRQGALSVARDEYERALRRARQTDDVQTIAACYTNLGQACALLNDFPAAIDALQQARNMVQALGMTTEVARNDWALARVLLQQGAFEKAIPMLRSVRERFLQWDMIEEAGLTALYLVDALVATADRASAIALTETVIVDFRTAGMNERALTALSYLRDLLPSHEAPRAPIHHVRAYLESLRSAPARVFLPLP